VTPSVVVGVAIDPAERRARWVAELSLLMDGCRVVDAAQVDPAEVDVLVVGNPPGSTLTGYPSLRFVQSTWAGVDQLVEGAPAVPIARLVAPALTALMSEFVLTAVLMAHRGLLEYRRRQMRTEWKPEAAVIAADRKVGVLGFGALGEPAALRLREAGFDVAAWARTVRPAAVPVVVGPEGLRELLARSEVVVDLLPLTAATRDLLDRDAFALMPPGSTLINVARGGHVVEADLIEALDRGHLADAVLDVFREEPLPPDHPFWSHPRVTVLPHVAAPSRPSDLAPAVAANIELFLSGEEPDFLVGP
jgi:glyoxylate/hydroxypyruvate reductase